MLNTRELLDIAGLLTNVRRVQDYYKEDEEGTVIDKLFLSLHPNRFLEEKITTAILDENEIADAASPELAEIRRHKRAAAAKGRQILQRIISSPSYRNVLQDALITQRGGRFVVPVKAECRGALPGLERRDDLRRADGRGAGQQRAQGARSERGEGDRPHPLRPLGRGGELQPRHSVGL